MVEMKTTPTSKAYFLPCFNLRQPEKNTFLSAADRTDPKIYPYR
jgi:hypothetical protein